MWFVYILKCNDSSSYVGCTIDVHRRVDEHNSKKVHYTRDKAPVKLVTYISFSDKYKAFEFEKYLKSGSGRAFLHKRLFY
jgi:predicted GIY-YIG superfamily endonuclease